MKVGFKVTGARQLEAKLALLPRSTAKGVVRRAMKKELEPVASMANALWPGADDDVFGVGPRVTGGQPFPPRGKFIVSMLVGTTGVAPHAHLIEWGTGPRHHNSGKYVGAVSPNPMLQPAWDAHKAQILAGLAATLGAEITKTMLRRANRKG